MAVVFDAKAPSHTEATAGWATASAATWTHTPVGTPRGVLLAIVQGGGTGDQVSTVTYGGVAMTRVRSDINATAELGRTYLYFLGSGIPTGAQTVSVTSTGTTPKYAVSHTFTANADTFVVASNGADLGVTANPSLTVTFPTTVAGWAGVAAHFYGGAAPVTTGLQTNETYSNGPDFGALAGMTYRRSNGASAASTTFGYTTLTADDELISAAVIAEDTGLTQALYTGIEASPTAQTGPSWAITPFGADSPAIGWAGAAAPSTASVALMGAGTQAVTHTRSSASVSHSAALQGTGTQIATYAKGARRAVSLMGSGLQRISPNTLYEVPAPTGGDDTAMIQAFVASVPDGTASDHNTVRFAEGRTYRIDSALTFTSRNYLDFALNTATLDWNAANDDAIRLLRFITCLGIKVSGPGTLLGTYAYPASGDAHDTTFQHMHAVHADGSDVTLDKNLLITDFYGDGIYYGNSGTTLSTGRVDSTVDIRRVGRNGVSVVGGDSITISAKFQQCGFSWIDLEPNPSTNNQRATNIDINGCQFGSQVGTLENWGVILMPYSGGTNSQIADVKIRNCTATSRDLYIRIGNSSATGLSRPQRIQVRNNHRTDGQVSWMVEAYHIDTLDIFDNDATASGASIAHLGDNTDLFIIGSTWDNVSASNTLRVKPIVQQGIGTQAVTHTRSGSVASHAVALQGIGLQSVSVSKSSSRAAALQGTGTQSVSSKKAAFRAAVLQSSGTQTANVRKGALAGVSLMGGGTQLVTHALDAGLSQALYTALLATPATQTGPSWTLTPSTGSAPAIGWVGAAAPSNASAALMGAGTQTVTHTASGGARGSATALMGQGTQSVAHSKGVRASWSAGVPPLDVAVEGTVVQGLGVQQVTHSLIRNASRPAALQGTGTQLVGGRKGTPRSAALQGAGTQAVGGQKGTPRSVSMQAIGTQLVTHSTSAGNRNHVALLMGVGSQATTVSKGGIRAVALQGAGTQLVNSKKAAATVILLLGAGTQVSLHRKGAKRASILMGQGVVLSGHGVGTTPILLLPTVALVSDATATADVTPNIGTVDITPNTLLALVDAFSFTADVAPNDTSADVAPNSTTAEVT